MSKREKRSKKETRAEFKEVKAMKSKLHEMLRFFGEEQVGSVTIKLDQFQKLRLQFNKNAQTYEDANNQIKFQSNVVERAKIIFVLTDSKKIMEDNLRQMTALVMKLSQKVKRQKGTNKENGQNSKSKKKGKYYEVAGQVQQKQSQQSPLQQELQYKALIVYTLQKNFFKLIKKEDKQVNNLKRDLNNKNYATLQDFKKQNLPIDRLLQAEHEQTLQQKEILEALKGVDDMIEQKMDKILEGIKILNYNAINISQGLDNVHKQILINLDKIEHNQENLKKNQKRMDEAAKHVTKPSCICNVIIAVLLGLIGFLVVKLVWFQN